MSLKETIQNDMKTAMRAQDAVRLGAIRMLTSEIKKREIDKKAPLDETEIQKVVSTLIKQRNESIEAFVKGGRQDLADKEKKEIEALSGYLPAQLSREEVEAIVVGAIQESGAKAPGDIGKVMKIVVPKIAGRADGKLVNEIARAKLAGG